MFEREPRESREVHTPRAAAEWIASAVTQACTQTSLLGVLQRAAVELAFTDLSVPVGHVCSCTYSGPLREGLTPLWQQYALSFKGVRILLMLAAWIKQSLNLQRGTSGSPHWQKK